MSTAAVAGLVPAAGASRRMGRPKALLDAAGLTFVERAVRALRDGGCTPVLVTVPPGGHDIAAAARAAGADVLVNPAPGDGPITSVRLVVTEAALAPCGLALLPVDHPLVRADTVAVLLRALRTGGAPLVLPTYRGRRGHPPVFDRTLIPHLLDPALQGGARTVVHAHLDRALLVPVDDAGVVTDIDTPAAYREAFPPAEGEA